MAEGRSLPESGLMEDQQTGDEPATNELRENELVARSFELEGGLIRRESRERWRSRKAGRRDVPLRSLAVAISGR